MHYLEYLVACAVILCACIAQPTYAAEYCINNRNVQVPCTNEIQHQYFYPYTPYPYSYQYVDRRPDYRVPIDKPSVPHHNWGDCMLSLGCKR